MPAHQSINLKSILMTQNVYIGIGLLLIGSLILYFGFDDPDDSITFILMGAAPIGFGYFLIKRAIIEYEPETKVSYSQWQRALKTNGIPITVDFDQCELLNNQYREEVEKGYGTMSESAALNVLMGQEEPDYYDIDQSVLVFKTVINGKKLTFYSAPINKEKVSLQLLLGTQKTTILYVNPNDMDSYYFDLEFIKSR